MPLVDPSSPPALEVGDHVPRWFLPRADGSTFRSTQLDGRLAIIAFVSHTDVARKLDGMIGRLHESHTPVVYVVGGPPDRAAEVGHVVGPKAFVCQDGEPSIAAVFGAKPGELRLMDRNVRVAGICRDAACDAEVARLMDVCMALARGYPQEQIVQAAAPALFIPRVLSPEQCAELMDLYHRLPNVYSRVSRTIDGKPALVVNPQLKLRRDAHLPAEERARFEHPIFSRICVEMKKCFQFAVTHYDGLKVCRYDAAEAGFFGQHRDDTNARNAHWRFAMSLNLNDDYDGGTLRFPEYGDALHKPEAGAAVVFSCSLLHEAKPVTRGQRFVALTFMYTAEDSKKGLEKNKFGGFEIGKGGAGGAA